MPGREAFRDDDFRHFLLRFPNLLKQIAVPVRAHRFTANEWSESVHQEELNPYELSHDILM